MTLPAIDILGEPAQFGAALMASLLVVATIAIVALNHFSGRSNPELNARLKSWWVIIIVFCVAILSTPTVLIIIFGFISFLAFKEYVSIVPLRRVDRRVIFWAYMAIPIQYLFVGFDRYGLFIVFIPVWVFFLLPFRLVVAKQTDGFLTSVSSISWGLMVTVFAISHAAMLTRLPADSPSVGVGLLLFLVILNQGNDVAQYVWGRSFGKRPITPTVSPKKTWEGFLGGVATTMAAAALIGGVLTPFDPLICMLFGALIAVSGFVGDVVVSAVKRDLGVKDAGSLIPGHGGVLDRVDSLCLSAPLFFHVARFFYF